MKRAPRAAKSATRGRAAIRAALLAALSCLPLAGAAGAQGAPVRTGPEGPVEPLEQRLAQRWRWREITGEEGLPSFDFVAAWPRGTVVARNDSGLHVYDGWGWAPLPGGLAFSEGDLRDVLASGDGYVVVRGDSLTAVDAAGSVRGVLELPDDDVFVQAGRDDEGRRRVAGGGMVRLVAAAGAASGPGWTDLFPSPPGASRVSALGLLSGGSLLALASEGLWRSDRDGWQRLSYPEGGTNLGAFAGGVALTASTARALYVLPERLDESSRGLVLVENGVRPMEPPPHPLRVRAVTALRDGSLVVLDVDASLHVYRSGQWIEADAPLPSAETPRALALTDDERLVLACRTGGVWAADMASRRWEQLDPDPDGTTSVNGLAPARGGGVWMATAEGLMRWDGAGFAEPLLAAGETGVRLVRLTAVHEDAAGDLWVGSGSAFSGVLRRHLGEWTLHDDPQVFAGQLVHAIREVDGEPWMLLLGDTDEAWNLGGLVRWDGAAFERIAAPAGEPLARTYAVAQPRSDRLLVGTRGQILLREGRPDAARWSALPLAGPDGRSVLATQAAFALHEEPDGRLWAGRSLDVPGVAMRESGRWRVLEEGPWRNTAATGFVRTRSGALWIVGTHGLHRMDGTVPRRVSGMLASERFWPAIEADDGGLWLGHLGEGLVRFRPDDVHAPRIARLDAGAGADGRPVVRWQASDFWNDTPPASVRLRWRLDGGAWRETSGPRELRPDEADWGEHLLEARAVDDFGNLEPEARSVRFSVPPPLLLRPPLLALMAALAVAMGWASVQGRRQRHERREARRRQNELTERLTALTLRLLSTQEEERKRLSRDMHDDLGQLLTAICLDVQRAATLLDGSRRSTALDQALSTARQALDRVREISTSLRPTVLDDHGLREAVGSSLSEFTRRTGVDVQADVALDDVFVPPPVAAHVYRILQESLTNVARHAAAETAHVSLHKAGRSIELTVRDDGRGFDPARGPEGGHFGLLSMRERAELMGGSFELRSTPGAGTTVRVTIPLED